MKVFLVEDSDELREIWASLFRRTSHDVSLFACGQEVIDRFAVGELPDLLITDYFLPDISGLEILGELRKVHPHVPCLIVSGSDNQKLIDSIDAAGNTFHLKKPVRFKVMLEEIEQLIGVLS